MYTLKVFVMVFTKPNTPSFSLYFHFQQTILKFAFNHNTMPAHCYHYVISFTLHICICTRKSYLFSLVLLHGDSTDVEKGVWCGLLCCWATNLLQSNILLECEEDASFESLDVFKCL